MDDTFRVRIDKAFGSLTATSNLSSLWCLTDDEIDKKEWNRDSPIREQLEFDSKPCPPHLDGFFAAKPQQTLAPPDFCKQLKSDLEELSDGEEQDGDEESEIRSGIGLDCTLDYEEEEDEYDKVAIGKVKEKQQPSDRLYMREVSDYGISSNTYHELPLTLEDVKRDPRANHLAAKIRLEEDDSEAALGQGHVQIPGQDNAHSPKRLKLEEDTDLPTDSSSVPDYIRNPSKYTYYTLDASDDMDEESNRKAYMDALSLIKKRVQFKDDDSSNDFQKLPTFTPRMKKLDPGGSSAKQGVEMEQMRMKGTVLSIADVESDHAQVSAMEEDESSITAADTAIPGRLQKPSRSYRTRAIMDSDDHNA